MRFTYTLKKGFQFRRDLVSYLEPDHQLHHVTALTAKRLNTLHIQALVLDFDGVLAPHGEIAPLPAVETWLHDLGKIWPGQIFILSNKPFQAREDYLKAHFPSIQFIKDVAKKPYPDGLNKITALAQCQPQEVLIVDDRLLTGMLAACVSGTQALLLHPAVRKSGMHRHELFFAGLRFLDRCLIGIFK